MPSRPPPTLTAAQRQDALDAARYRFLRTQAKGYSLGLDGTQSWCLNITPLTPVRTATFDEAIDQAMQEAAHG